MKMETATRTPSSKMHKSKQIRKTSHIVISSSFSSWKFIPSLAIVFILANCVSAQETNLTEPQPFTPGQSRPKNVGHQCGPLITIKSLKTTKCSSYTTIPTDIPTDWKSEVQVLDMSSGNSLQILKKDALSEANLVSLQALIVSHCSIGTIEHGAFNNAQNLKMIDLSHNRIEKLDPQVFVGLQQLKTLYLQNNEIYQVVSIFPPLPLLGTLDLSQCRLNGNGFYALDTFDNLQDLKKLSLSGNELQWLDWRVLQNLKKLAQLDLAENPWICDCRVKFLKRLEDRGFPPQTVPTCNSVGSGDKSLVGKKWVDVPEDAMSCEPVVHNLYWENEDGGKTVELDQTVFFECDYSGHPRPHISWLKDGKSLVDVSKRQRREVPEEPPKENQTIGTGNDTSGGGAATEPEPIPTATKPPPPPAAPPSKSLAPKISIVDDSNEDPFNYQFRSRLIIKRIEEKDNGTYTCVAAMPPSLVWKADKTEFLNVSVTHEAFLGILPGGKKGVAIWIWLLVGLICVLLSVVICLLTYMVWKRREKKRHEGFRKVVQEKFKDSNIDLGELGIKPTAPNQIDGATPLLDSRSETSTLPMAENNGTLPDVALGNATLVRNSQIFSPKPPPAIHGYHGDDARKEFFARQISEPYLRPGSAMSLSRPAALNASQRRYIFANQMYNQSAPAPGEENLYEVPGHIRQLPRSGSAMSMSAVPEDDLRRQMFLRQYAQPQSQYATAMRIPPGIRRLPSTTSEPPPEMASAFQYSTLPRRPIRLQSWSRPVSPTNSTCSTYSTLSWRPNIDPRTGVASDGMGTRNTALGGSSQSVNTIPDMSGRIIGGGDTGNGIDSMNRAMLTPSSGGKVKGARTPRYGHSRTPSSLTRGHNDFFSFEPIQEVESSECASNHNLDRAGGRQTPTGAPYSTQSLARGEPRYKRKKPPPIAMIPTNLKLPSGAFDHLKGRSVSPALKAANNNVVNGEQPTEEKPSTTDARPDSSNSNNEANTSSIPVPVLESPIDEETAAAAAASTTRPTSKIGPPPPPKPKRAPNQEDGAAGDSPQPQLIDESEKSNVADGTVV